MARTPPVDVDRVRLPAFTLADELSPSDSGWHAHGKHQLLFASAGALELVTEEGTHLLPPQRAACIRAHVRHRVRARGRVSLRTIYFAARVRVPAGDCRVFPVPDVLREMIVHSTRWGASHVHDRTARAFYTAILALLRDVAEDGATVRLPSAKTPFVERLLELLSERLDDSVSVPVLARRFAMSVRTFERRLREETGTGHRELVRRMRVLRAMELLSRPGARVTEVAMSVGFENLSAFCRAFRAVTGETPSGFMRGRRSAKPAR